MARRARRRRLLQGIALAVASLAATLLVLEAGFRIFGVFVGTHYINRRTTERSSDDRLMFQLKPNSIARAEVEYRINARGMRDDPVEIAKPPGTKRVVVLGDSIAFGYWVAVEDAFPAQLESMLEASGNDASRFEVLNFGVPGYDLSRDVGMLRSRAMQFGPDLVILGFCLNDVNAVFSHEYGLVVDRERERAAGGWTRLLGLALDHSLLLSWIDYRLTEFSVRRRAARRVAVLPSPPEKRLWARLQLEKGFAEFAQILAEGGGIPGLVAIFPTFDYRFDRYPHGWLHELVADSARAQGLHVVDLLRCFRNYPLHDLRVDPVHPSPMGHRIGAHGILDAVAAYDLLGPENIDLSAFGDCKEYRRDDFPTVRGY